MFEKVSVYIFLQVGQPIRNYVRYNILSSNCWN